MGFPWFGRNKPRPSGSVLIGAQSGVTAPATRATDAPDRGAHASPTPSEALALLKAGNAAFLSGETQLGHVTAKDLEPLQGGQKPIATIVGCADSRTPPTILFNQGLGRLFIIRVAGNTVDRRGLASIVYAVKHLSCPLVVVLGHTGCGAVAAAEAVVDGRAELDP